MTRPNARRRLDAKVRAVADSLRRDWDPIGLRAMPELPADEYDSYAPAIVSMLEHGEPDATIAAYLKELEDDTIGVTSGSNLVEVAALLRRAASTVAPNAR